MNNGKWKMSFMPLVRMHCVFSHLRSTFRSQDHEGEASGGMHFTAEDALDGAGVGLEAAEALPTDHIGRGRFTFQNMMWHSWSIPEGGRQQPAEEPHTWSSGSLASSFRAMLTLTRTLTGEWVEGSLNLEEIGCGHSNS